MNDRVAAERPERLRRLRWRLRGALVWPLFVLLTVVDAAVLHWLPIAGEGTHWVPALLLAGCLNIAAVALLGVVGGAALRRLRPGLPRVVADDCAGTTALVVLAAGLVVGGAVHHPALATDRDAFGAQSLAVRRWVDAHGDAVARAHVDSADSIVLEPTLFRTCVPGRDPHVNLCLIVDTSVRPPRVRRDANSESNASFNALGAFR